MRICGDDVCYYDVAEISYSFVMLGEIIGCPGWLQISYRCTVFIWIEASMLISYDFNPVFVWALLHFTQVFIHFKATLDLFRSRCLYEPCFYLDKYSNCLATQGFDVSRKPVDFMIFISGPAFVFATCFINIFIIFG